MDFEQLALELGQLGNNEQRDRLDDFLGNCKWGCDYELYK